MARTITNEEIKLSIVINGNEAQQKLISLEKDTRSLNKANEELRKKQRELVAQGQKNSQEYKNLSSEIKNNTLAITSNKQKMNELQKEIGTTGLTMQQLRTRATQLRATLGSLIPGSADFNRIQAELNQTNERLKELSGRAVTARMSLGSIADGFNRYAALGTTIIAGFTGVYFSLQKIVDMSGKLSTAIAGVAKTTGMTKQEVEELAKSFSKLDTPTSKADLLGIAKIGGLLNVAKEDIFDFVKIMDITNVALGDAFQGGAEAIANKLGKIKGLFEDTKNLGIEDAFNSIGSALNDLGAAGAATEENITDFVTRIGTMPEALRPTIQEALGLGAAFEESGLQAELASNNYSKLLGIAARDVGSFAKQMNMPIAKVKELINTNPTEFFLQFAESVKGLEGTDLAEVLNKLKLNDQEVLKVISSASQNIDVFRDKIKLANDSYLAGTSLTKEYAIMNETLAAVLAKVGKTLTGIFTSDFVVNGLTSFVTWFAKLIGATEDADNSTKTFRNTLIFTVKMITIVTAALLSAIVHQKLWDFWNARNTAGNLLYTISLKARIVAENIGIVASQGYAMATMLLTGNVKGAAQAFRVLTATMMTTPWGFIIGAIAAIGTAYLMFRDSAKEAANAQSILNDAYIESKTQMQKEVSTLNTLIAIAKDETQSKLAREKAIKKINEISPEYLGNLTLENIKTLDAKNAIDLYIKSLEKQYTLKSLEARADEIRNKLNEKKKKDLEEEIDLWDKIWVRTKNILSPVGAAKDIVITAVDRRTKALGDLQKGLDLTNEQMKKFLEKNPDLIGNFGGEETPPGTPPAENPKTKSEKDYTEELKRLKNEQLGIEREAIDAKLQLLIDGLEKEKAIELERNRRAIQDLNARVVSEGEIALALAKSKDSKLSKQEREYWKTQEKSWKENNKHVYSLIESENSQHLNRMNAIAVKSHSEYIKQLELQFKDESATIELAYAEKRISKEEKEKQLLDLQVKYLENTISQLNDTIAKNTIDGLDLSMVLSDEEVENTVQLIKKLQTELGNLKNPEAKKDDLGDNAFSFANPNVDILGFSPDQWTQVFDNLDSVQGRMALVNMSIGAMQQMWQAYAQIQNNNAQKEVQIHERATSARTRALKRQLDLGLISQDQYNKKVEKLEADLDAKKAEIEYQQAKRQRTMALANIAISTAQGIMQLWVNPGFPAAIPMAVALGAAGIMQAAVVMSQPLPAKGYEEGYYDVVREQDKKPFKAKYGGSMTTGLFNKPTILVGEGAGDHPELVVDKKAFAQISPSVKNALLYELGIMKGFENGYYKNVSQTAPQYNAPATSTNNEAMVMMMQLMQENINVLREIKENGVIGKFYDRDLESMKAINRGLQEYSEITNKAKR